MSGHTEDEQAPIILPAADYITRHYSWNDDDGPIVTDIYDNRQRLTRATVTEYDTGELDADAEGYRIRNDGSRDQRYGRGSPVHSRGLTAKIKAALVVQQAVNP